MKQSPVDIILKEVVQKSTVTLKNKLPNLKSHFSFEYDAVKFSADEDGKGKTIVEGDGKDEEYMFLHFQIHSPSEHKIDGFHYDAEVQFHHKSSKDDEQYMVISVLLDTDSGHWKSTADFFEHFEFGKWEDWEEEEESEELKVNIRKFFDRMEDKSFWNYEGSLTTPPCTEGVRWFVIREVQWINPDHLSFLQKRF